MTAECRLTRPIKIFNYSSRKNWLISSFKNYHKKHSNCRVISSISSMRNSVSKSYQCRNSPHVLMNGHDVASTLKIVSFNFLLPPLLVHSIPFSVFLYCSFDACKLLAVTLRSTRLLIFVMKRRSPIQFLI